MPTDYEVFVKASVSVGKDHYIRIIYWTPDGRGIGTTQPEDDWVAIGLNEYHKNELDQWCGGYITFDNVPEAALYIDRYGGKLSGHVLDNLDPVSVSPSLQCKSCPSHGFIKAGCWSDA